MKNQAALSLETEKCLEKYRRRTRFRAVFSLKQIAHNSICKLKATNHVNNLIQTLFSNKRLENLAPNQIRLPTYQNRAVLTDDILRTTTSPPSSVTMSNLVHKHKEYLKQRNRQYINEMHLKATAGSTQSYMSGETTNSAS